LFFSTNAVSWVCHHPLETRKSQIYYGLAQEENLSEVYQRAPDWLLDPLNPHAIAATRRNTYTRFTILSIVRCLLDFADSEFTQDTAESLPRARSLYSTALELLDAPELKQRLNGCDDIIGRLPEADVRAPGWTPVLKDLKRDLETISNAAQLRQAAQQLQPVFSSDGPPDRRYAAAREIVARSQGTLPTGRTLGTALREKETLAKSFYRAVLSNRAVADAAQTVASAVGAGFLSTISAATGIEATRLESERVELPLLRDRGGLVDGTAGSASLPGPSSFCIPPNPVLKALRLHAEINLFKLQTCRNIAGMKRQLES
jgi:hypothetical protein